MKKLIIIILLSLSLTGCFLDPYQNTNDAKKAVELWFTYKNGDDDLGQTRRKIENIFEIKKEECKYIENDKNKHYIYKCDIEYSPIGETIIPLSNNEKKSFYVALTYNDDRTYSYIVYNSTYQESPWLLDETLNYNKN